jgi:hypothetical protein
MGWAGGGEVFDPVARELILRGANKSTVYNVCKVLIAGLQERGWDTEAESLGEFAEVGPIVLAFAANGILGFDPEDPDGD